MEAKGRGGCIQKQDCLSWQLPVIIANSPHTGGRQEIPAGASPMVLALRVVLSSLTHLRTQLRQADAPRLLIVRFGESMFRLKNDKIYVNLTVPICTFGCLFASGLGILNHLSGVPLAG